MRLYRSLPAAAATLLTAGAALAIVVGMNTAYSAEDNQACRPDGLYRTPGLDVPYCAVYDTNGREKLGTDHGRRIIGYFTAWRHGKDGQPAYLVNNIPWDKVTHINYAFAHVDGQNQVSVGGANPNNPAIGMTWPGIPGAEVDTSLPYQGHFNLLTKYKRANPNVRTLISVGGWARDRRVLRRQRHPRRQRWLLPDDHQLRQQRQHGRHQRLRRLGGELPSHVRL